jgi:hypothetical protein
MFFKLLLVGILVARFVWCFETPRFNAKNVMINGLVLMVAIATLVV